MEISLGGIISVVKIKMIRGEKKRGLMIIESVN